MRALHGYARVMLEARAAGHRHLNELTIDVLTTYKADMAQLTGVTYGGVGAP